jgi:hypothetical protein
MNIFLYCQRSQGLVWVSFGLLVILKSDLNLSEIITDEDSVEDVLHQLNMLLKKEVISSETYDAFKIDILKKYD